MIRSQVYPLYAWLSHPDAALVMRQHWCHACLLATAHDATAKPFNTPNDSTWSVCLQPATLCASNTTRPLPSMRLVLHICAWSGRGQHLASTSAHPLQSVRCVRHLYDQPLCLTVHCSSSGVPLLTGSTAALSPGHHACLSTFLLTGGPLSFTKACLFGVQASGPASWLCHQVADHLMT